MTCDHRLLLSVLSLVILGTAGAALAQEHVEEAQVRMAAMDYAAAEQVLAEGLASGTLDRAGLAATYREIGLVHGVFGRAEEAETAFRRSLALDPTASLPDGLAPKVVEPFESARAHLASRPPLAVQAIRQGNSLLVQVTDPVAIVVSVRLDGEEESRAIDEKGEARFTSVSSGPLEVRALDELGNVVASTSTKKVEASGAKKPVSEVGGPQTSAGQSEVRWQPWAVTGGGVLLVGAGAWLGAAASSNIDRYDTRLSEVCGMSGCRPDEIPEEVRDIESTAKLQNRAGIAAIVVGGAAVAAGVTWMLLDRSDRNTETATQVSWGPGSLPRVCR